MTAINASRDTLNNSNLPAFLYKCDAIPSHVQLTFDALYTGEHMRVISHLCVKHERPLIVLCSIIFTLSTLEEKNRCAQAEKLALSQL